MRQTLLLASLFFLPVLVAPCQTPAPAPATPPATTTPPELSTLPTINVPLNTPSTVHVDDDKFLKEASAAGMAEEQLGKLAADKASRDDVKKFGQKMADDHAKVDDGLKAAAAKKNVALPASLDAKQKARIDKLSKLSGNNFDKAFIKDQLKLHETNVKDFSDESQYGSDANVMGFASTTLPVLKQHLEMVKALAKAPKKTQVK